MVLGALRTIQARLAIAVVVGSLGIAQFITGCALGSDVYKWGTFIHHIFLSSSVLGCCFDIDIHAQHLHAGLCAFTVLTALAGIGLGGHVLFYKGRVDLQIECGLFFSFFLVNLQSVFVMSAASAPLAENFANNILSAYEDVVSDFFGSLCSGCMDAESTITDQMLDSNSQNFAGETAFVVLSVLQVRLNHLLL